MVFGRMFGVVRFGVSLGAIALSALTACAGKRDGGGENGGGDSGGGSGGSGGSTSSHFVVPLNQKGVSKLDLLFTIDNSISMADKQRLLAEALPVLVQRLVDPICVDSDGNPTGGTAYGGCPGSLPEHPPVQDIHIGVITSSLGNHGGDVCVPDPEDFTRTLNDKAQLIASMRTGLYSYQGQGFLVWDPRTGADRPVPDPHPGVGANEQAIPQFIMDFTSHVTAAGERGCSYEASLEAWYRFLIDPEPIADVTNDGIYTVRGPINNVVLTQRAAFMRPDSLLAIVMLTDENDCSIKDENDAQGWLVGRQTRMPRASSECARPDNPDSYACCRPCVIDLPGCPPSAGDVECQKGPSLTEIEDSMNLRCHKQSQRFGVDLLYAWQRYVDGLTSARISLRTPGPSGNRDVTNPIFTPGTDGTPAREPEHVFLVGIVGVPWQDIADEASLQGASLRYLTSAELPVTGMDRWNVILGDPDTGRPPSDPFMIESIDPRSGMNPITGEAITPPTPGIQGNSINGHEQNAIARDDLQYACRFDRVPDVPCTPENQDGCDCNASEQDYNRPTCEYPGPGMDGAQTHAKAYPSVRQLQVLKEFGDNAIVASICPKNVVANGPAAEDPNYGYNPAVVAMADRFNALLVAPCFPRPLETNGDGQVACTVVEVGITSECSCDRPGRTNLTSPTVRVAVYNDLTAKGYCGPSTPWSCSDYCYCEIEELAGSALETCQNSLTSPGDIYGFCYVDPSNGHGDPALVAECPVTQRQIIRLMGPDVPRPDGFAVIACPGSAN